MNKTILAAVSLLSLAVTATPAMAADLGNGFSVGGGATLVSDYRFRGISQTDKRFAVQGTFTVSHSMFHDNQAVGGLDNGVPGGFGAGIGGAISNVARFGNAILAVSHSTFLDNRAIGGAAGTGGNAQVGRGGAIANYIFGGVPLPVTVTATATVTHSTLIGNQAIGGAGTTGGIGQGGGIATLNGGTLTVSDSLIALNRAIGGAGNGGPGGNGLGGGIFNGGPSTVGTPSLALQRSLIALNRADGGSSDSGYTRFVTGFPSV